MESEKKVLDQRSLYLVIFRRVDGVCEFLPSLEFLGVPMPHFYPRGVSYLQSKIDDRVICVWEITEPKVDFERVFLELVQWVSIQKWYVSLPHLCNSEAHVNTNLNFVAELFRRFAGKQWTVFIREKDWSFLKDGLQQLKNDTDFKVRVPSNLAGTSKLLNFLPSPKKSARQDVPRWPEAALNSDPAPGLIPSSAPPFSESIAPVREEGSSSQAINESFHPPVMEYHQDAVLENPSLRSFPPSHGVEDQQSENPIAAQVSSSMFEPQLGSYIPDPVHPAEEYKEVLPSVDSDRSSAVPPAQEVPPALDTQRQDYIEKRRQKFEEQKQEAQRANPLFAFVPIPSHIPEEPADMSSRSLRHPMPPQNLQNPGQRIISQAGLLAEPVLPMRPPFQMPYGSAPMPYPFASGVPNSSVPHFNPPQQLISPGPIQPLPPNYQNPDPEYGSTLIKCSEEYLRCLICLSIFKDPLVTSCCGSIVCKVCAPRIRKCPVCRINTTLVPNKALSRILSGMTEKCACGMEIQGTSYEQHMFVCPNKKFSCPGCSGEWAKKEFKQHLKVNHRNLILAALARMPLSGSERSRQQAALNSNPVPSSQEDAIVSNSQIIPPMKEVQTGLYLMVCRCLDDQDYFFPSLEFINCTKTPLIHSKVTVYAATAQTVFIWLEATGTEEANGFDCVFSELEKWNSLPKWYVSLPYPCTSGTYVEANVRFAIELFSRIYGKQLTIFVQHDEWDRLQEYLEGHILISGLHVHVAIPGNVAGESELLKKYDRENHSIQ